MEHTDRKIKVLWIFRKPSDGAFSIELLFESMFIEMSKKVELYIYKYNSKLSLLQNIIEIKQYKVDIYHVTGGNNYISLFLPKNKTILTIHDLDHYLLTLKGLKKVIYGLLFFRIPKKKVAKFTAISSSTKNNLLKYFQISEDNISVINNCYHSRFKRLNSIPKENNSILQIGTKKNKNLDRVIDAICNLDYKLIIIGRLCEQTELRLKKNHINYINFVALEPEEVVNEYNKASMVIFASTSEGFGLPILEAQATETPVITSDLEPMRTILGHDLSLVDPYSIDSIKNMIIKVSNDTEFAAKIVDLGNENIKKYTTSYVCQAYYDEYLKIKNSSYK